jgi:hypothetical protein
MSFDRSAKRVAEKFASLIKNKNFPHPIHYEEDFTVDYSGIFLVLSLQYERLDVGCISGYKDILKDVSAYQCASDILSLSEQHPSVNTNKGEVRLVAVGNSELYEPYRGVGLGIQMYTEFLRSFWDRDKEPFVFIPDACDVGQTSQDARRVWASLARNKPSSNLCIAILKRP